MGYAFISYSSKNQSSADAMRELFKKNKIDTWMAPYDIPAGSKYAAVITRAIRDCSCFVLLLSNDSQASDAVDSEVELAALTFKKSIIIVELEKVILNDAFTFYIHNKHIIALHKIYEKSPEVKKVLDAVKAYTGEHKNIIKDISAELLNAYAAKTEKENTSKNFPYTIVTPNFDEMIAEAFLIKQTREKNMQKQCSVKEVKVPTPPSVKLGYSDCVDLENKNGGLDCNKLVIPDKYTEISGNAFGGIHCEKIYIPHGITYINDTSLVNLGYNVKTVYIHEMNNNYMINKESGHNVLFDLNRNINIPIKSGVSLEYYYK